MLFRSKSQDYFQRACRLAIDEVDPIDISKMPYSHYDSTLEYEKYF